MDKEGFSRSAKPVLVFNGNQTLVAVARSVRSTYELTKGNLQAISHACTGRFISTGGYYYRHLDPSIEIEMTDIGVLKLQDYDAECGLNRKYHSVKKMAHKRAALFTTKNTENE